MSLISEGVITGPEAHGRAAIAVEEDGSATLTLSALWVAPGAPDVRVYVTDRDDGALDETAIDLGRMPDRATRHAAALPASLDPARLTAVIIYCKVFSVHFGSATLISTT